MNSWPETIRLPAPVRNVVLSVTPASASRDVEAEVRAAYERGRAEGEAQLAQQLVQQRADVQHLLEGVIASLRESVPQIARDTEQHMVGLSLEIAQKVVADIPISVELVEAVVRDAISQVEGTAELHIRLHPADYELLQQMNSALLAPGAESRTVRFHSSPEVTRGGCLVQTRFGIVDARRETKLDLLKRSLIG